jgi:hypothetical protein
MAEQKIEDFVLIEKKLQGSGPNFLEMTPNPSAALMQTEAKRGNERLKVDVKKKIFCNH